MANPDLPLEIMEEVIDQLAAEGSRVALKSLGLCSKDYRQRVFQRIYKIIELISESQISAFRTFVERQLIHPSNLPKVRIELPGHRSPDLEYVMNRLLSSTSLGYFELRGQAGLPSSAEFHSFSLRIVATAKQQLTVVLVNLGDVTWRYCKFAHHLELRNSSLVVDYPPPGQGFDIPLQTLSISTAKAMESLDIFDTLRGEFLHLTHLLLYFKPDKEGFEAVPASFWAALSTAQSLEDITLIYERG